MRNDQIEQALQVLHAQPALDLRMGPGSAANSEFWDDKAIAVSDSLRELLILPAPPDFTGRERGEFTLMLSLLTGELAEQARRGGNTPIGSCRAFVRVAAEFGATVLGEFDRFLIGLNTEPVDTDVEVRAQRTALALGFLQANGVLAVKEGASSTLRCMDWAEIAGTLARCLGPILLVPGVLFSEADRKAIRDRLTRIANSAKEVLPGGESVVAESSVNITVAAAAGAAAMTQMVSFLQATKAFTTVG